MSTSISSGILAWMLTYALHSTALLLGALVLTRWRRITPAAAEIIWKSALLGGLFTASLQSWLDLRPAGSLALGESRPAQPTHSEVPARLVAERIGEPVPAASERSEAPALLTSGRSEDAASAPPASSLPSPTDTAIGAWLVIALLLASGYAARRLILVGRLGDREVLTSGNVHVMLSELAHAAKVRAPRLTVTDRISSPVALGMREICLPVSALTELDAEQQRSMLAHELAHVARRDPLWLLVTSGMERVFWFQPLNRVARREISTAAELLCDDWAVQRTGSGEALARCLAQVAEWIQASPLGVPVAGMAEERSLLVTRVARLLENRVPAMTRSRVVLLGVIAVLAGTVAMVPTVAGKPLPLVASTQAPAASASRDTLPDEMPGTYALPVEHDDEGHRVLTSADSAVVIALIARLKDTDAEVRAAAAEALAKLEDSRAVPGLAEALRDADPRVRIAAAEALAQFKDKRAIAALENALLDPSPEVQKHALNALSNFAEDGGLSVGPIVKILDSRDPEIIAGAIQLLAEMKERSATAAIAQRLTHENAEVRQHALQAMEELRGALSPATMLTLMRDRDADIRQRAAQIAGERQMAGVVSGLVALLEDADSDVRVSAVESLANIADDSAHSALKKALTAKDSKVRKAAVEALGNGRPE